MFHIGIGYIPLLKKVVLVMTVGCCQVAAVGITIYQIVDELNEFISSQRDHEVSA